MSVGATFQEKRDEFREFKTMLRIKQRRFQTTGLGLQVNYTCPNTGHRVDASAHEELEAAIIRDMEEAHDLDVAFIPKINVLLSIRQALKIAEHPRCNALCDSNTIPWGELSEDIDWKGLFGSDTSPLDKYGGGGLSGAPITKLVARWVNRYNRESHLGKPLIAGGGIMCAKDARYLLGYDCVHSVFIGTAAILRPWRVKSIIDAAHNARN